MSGKGIRAAIVVAACAYLVLGCLRDAGSRIDDAYIVFRYADHVVQGLGPVFNPGERVEGFTSPLWLLLVVGARAAGISGETAVTALGTLFAVAAVLATWRLARVVAPGWPAVTAAALVAVHPAHAMWAVHGLETPLFVALVASAFAAWGRERPVAAGVLFGLAFWTRPEAPLFVAILGALAMLRGERRKAFRLAGAALALAVPLLVARYAYFHSLVPNTFHAKTGGGLGRIRFGLGYARRFAVSHAALVVACGASLRRDLPPLVVDAIVCGGVWSIWVVWIGGDAFPGFRFFLPVVPLAGLVAAWGMRRALETGRRRGLTVAAAIAVPTLVAVGAAPDVDLERTTGEEFTAKMLAVGDWLGAHAPGDATIALNYVGAVPYRSGLLAIDMLGLTDEAVAATPIEGRFRFPGHAKGNGASILDRRPEMILMGGVYLGSEPMTELGPELDSEEQIVADPRFDREYRRMQVRIPASGGERWFAFYARRDWDWIPEGAVVE